MFFISILIRFKNNLQIIHFFYSPSYIKKLFFFKTTTKRGGEVILEDSAQRWRAPGHRYWSGDSAQRWRVSRNGAPQAGREKRDGRRQEALPHWHSPPAAHLPLFPPAGPTIPLRTQ